MASLSDLEAQALAAPDRMAETVLVSDQPRNSRGWDFEGTREQLAAECAKDRAETSAAAHIIHWNDADHWTAWRIFA